MAGFINSYQAKDKNLTCMVTTGTTGTFLNSVQETKNVFRFSAKLLVKELNKALSNLIYLKMSLLIARFAGLDEL